MVAQAVQRQQRLFLFGARQGAQPALISKWAVATAIASGGAPDISTGGCRQAAPPLDCLAQEMRKDGSVSDTQDQALAPCARLVA